MKNKKLFRVMTTTLCGVMAFSSMTSLVGCGGGGGAKKDSITIMTDELSGLFNPFYATSGADMDVVGMTQLSMLSTDEKGNPVAGDDHATVVKDFMVEVEGEGEDAQTVYTFVLKNNLKFSDGHPLTMEDVFFNMYEYLDPVYTGSSTMYSVDIDGLAQYRTQQNTSGDEDDGTLSGTANMLADSRVEELVQVYETYGRIGNDASTSFSLDEQGMKNAIYQHNVTDYY
jgi:ABC-type transport system substrate-binding protein